LKVKRNWFRFFWTNAYTLSYWVIRGKHTFSLSVSWIWPP